MATGAAAAVVRVVAIAADDDVRRADRVRRDSRRGNWATEAVRGLVRGPSEVATADTLATVGALDPRPGPHSIFFFFFLFSEVVVTLIFSWSLSQEHRYPPGQHRGRAATPTAGHPRLPLPKSQKRDKKSPIAVRR